MTIGHRISLSSFKACMVGVNLTYFERKLLKLGELGCRCWHPLAGDLMEMEEMATLTECLEAGEEACCNIANKKRKDSQTVLAEKTLWKQLVLQLAVYPVNPLELYIIHNFFFSVETGAVAVTSLIYLEKRTSDSATTLKHAHIKWLHSLDFSPILKKHTRFPKLFSV